MIKRIIRTCQALTLILSTLLVTWTKTELVSAHFAARIFQIDIASYVIVTNVLQLVALLFALASLHSTTEAYGRFMHSLVFILFVVFQISVILYSIILNVASCEFYSADCLTRTTILHALAILLAPIHFTLLTVFILYKCCFAQKHLSLSESLLPA